MKLILDHSKSPIGTWKYQGRWIFNWRLGFGFHIDRKFIDWITKRRKRYGCQFGECWAVFAGAKEIFLFWISIIIFSSFSSVFKQIFAIISAYGALVFVRKCSQSNEIVPRRFRIGLSYLVFEDVFSWRSKKIDWKYNTSKSEKGRKLIENTLECFKQLLC